MITHHLRNKKQFKISKGNIESKLLHWGRQFKYFHYFNPNDVDYPHGGFHHFFTAANKKINASDLNEVDRITSGGDGICGFISYETKNRFYPLKSPARRQISYPEFGFYIPQVVVEIENDGITIYSNDDPEDLWCQIIQTEIHIEKTSSPIGLNANTDKSTYIKNVQQIKERIVEGDYYEINYCIGFEGKHHTFDPVNRYLALCDKSPMPFSVLMKYEQKWLLCASPERFLKKEGQRLLSQPIKGTIKRGKNAEEDEELKHRLRQSEKEVAENMMIVDLVRNDLSKCASKGSVQVDELFGIYTFRSVHQMISTVSARIKEGLTFSAIIENTFPMGSMTGAPKLRVMQEIDALENQQRGLFSGTIGYIHSNGDFDFNVVIRSIFFDDTTKDIGVQVGSAITYDAHAEYEYDECLLKARPLFETIGHSGRF